MTYWTRLFQYIQRKADVKASVWKQSKCAIIQLMTSFQTHAQLKDVKVNMCAVL